MINGKPQRVQDLYVELRSHDTDTLIKYNVVLPTGRIDYAVLIAPPGSVHLPETFSAFVTKRDNTWREFLSTGIQGLKDEAQASFYAKLMKGMTPEPYFWHGEAAGVTAGRLFSILDDAGLSVGDVAIVGDSGTGTQRSFSSEERQAVEWLRYECNLAREHWDCAGRAPYLYLQHQNVRSLSSRAVASSLDLAG